MLSDENAKALDLAVRLLADLSTELAAHSKGREGIPSDLENVMADGDDLIQRARINNAKLYKI
jgi:hypothetical protein